MEAGDLAAVLVAVVCLAAIGILVVAVSSLVRTLRTLRETVDMLRSEAVPMVADLRRAVDHATAGLERVDDLLDTAEDISTTVDAASRLTYRALSPPLIGAASLAAGLGRFARRLRGGTPDRSTDDMAMMRRRLTWLLGGWLIGTASSVWLRRRVRRGVERYTPEHLRRDLADQGTAMVRNVRRIVGEVSDATRDGRAEVGRTRSALDHEYGDRRRHRPLRSLR
jgi:hypothetical protein